MPPSEQKLRGDESPPTDRHTWTSSGPRMMAASNPSIIHRTKVQPLKDFHINKITDNDLTQIYNEVFDKNQQIRPNSKMESIVTSRYIQEYN